MFAVLICLFACLVYAAYMQIHANLCKCMLCCTSTTYCAVPRCHAEMLYYAKVYTSCQHNCSKLVLGAFFDRLTLDLISIFKFKSIYSNQSE